MGRASPAPTKFAIKLSLQITIYLFPLILTFCIFYSILKILKNLKGESTMTFIKEAFKETLKVSAIVVPCSSAILLLLKILGAF
jgi:hypothetical protein